RSASKHPPPHPHPRRPAAGDRRAESRSVLLAECAAQLFATRLAPVGASHRVSIERSLSETLCPLHLLEASCPLHLFHQAPAESKVDTMLDIERATEECPRRSNFVASTCSSGQATPD